MNIDDELEIFNKFIELVKNSLCIVIVEGPNDKKSLEGLGIKDIICIAGNPLIKTVEDAEKQVRKNKMNGVVILTDFDRKGLELFADLNEEFTRRKVKVLNEPRELIKGLISHIEGLYTRYEHVKEAT